MVGQCIPRIPASQEQGLQMHASMPGCFYVDSGNQIWFVCIYLCAPCACLVSRGQKKVLDPLNLKLQTSVGHCVDAGNQTQVICKRGQFSEHLSHFSEHLSHFSSPQPQFFLLSRQTLYQLSYLPQLLETVLLPRLPNVSLAESQPMQCPHLYKVSSLTARADQDRGCSHNPDCPQALLAWSNGPS